jgi:hypothetical protein
MGKEWLEECGILLSNIFLHDRVKDRWDWNLDSGKG